MLLAYVRIQSKDRHTPDFPWRQSNVWPVFVAYAFRHTFFWRLSSRYLSHKQHQLPSVLIKYLCICSWICLLSCVFVDGEWAAAFSACARVTAFYANSTDRAAASLCLVQSQSIGLFSVHLFWTMYKKKPKPWNRFYHLHGQLRQIVGVDTKASTR